MKRLLFLILIMFLFSCKEDRFCWQCEIRVSSHRQEAFQQLPETTTTLKRCDLSEKEIKDYEKANNTIIVSDVTGYPVIVLLETKCRKQ